MKWGEEIDKLSPENFEVEHNEEAGCTVSRVHLGECLGLNEEGKRTKFPVYRLKCINHELVSKRFLEKK